MLVDIVFYISYFSTFRHINIYWIHLYLLSWCWFCGNFHTESIYAYIIFDHIGPFQAWNHVYTSSVTILHQFYENLFIACGHQYVNEICIESERKVNCFAIAILLSNQNLSTHHYHIVCMYILWMRKQPTELTEMRHKIYKKKIFLFLQWYWTHTHTKHIAIINIYFFN